ncbi:hypothetical protein OCO53_16255 [Peribacillus frigoritolerans]|nr:hypothetical protein [Peribacillus frigoritolerans]MCU6602026.1 hypothetical protein [Peribacillus frigoritolerans]
MINFNHGALKTLFQLRRTFHYIEIEQLNLDITRFIDAYRV